MVGILKRLLFSILLVIWVILFTTLIIPLMVWIITGKEMFDILLDILDSIDDAS